MIVSVQILFYTIHTQTLCWLHVQLLESAVHLTTLVLFPSSLLLSLSKIIAQVGVIFHVISEYLILPEVVDSQNEVLDCN